MRDKVLSFMKKHHMVSPGDHVICALSGGKDSMTLLHILLTLQDPLQFTLSAAHFNHRLRGEESARDEQFVKAFCAAWNIPLHCESRDVASYAAEHHLGIEEAARHLRYEFLFNLSPDAKIATAHNAEDNLETLLMHLIRGSGLNGLSGISPVRDRIIRPLLMTQRPEIEYYLEENRLPHVEDSTNDTDFCLRNRLRHHVLPILKAENPSVAGTVSALCLQLAQDENTLQNLAEETLHRATTQNGLSIHFLLTLQKNMALRVLRLFLSPVPQLQRIHLEQALSLCHCSSPSAQLSLPGDYVLRREYDSLKLDTGHTPSVLPPLNLSVGKSCVFGALDISSKVAVCPDILPENVFAMRMPESGEITLRSRLPGDRITLSGGTKKLSRYMIDRKIPAHLRDKLPVVVYDQQLAAILPLATDTQFQAKPGEDSLILTVERMEEVKNDP